MGIDLAPVALSIGRIIDLFSIGACDVYASSVTATVNPLVFNADIPLHAPVDDTLHTPLRKLIKQRLAEMKPRVYPGKISFQPNRVSVTLYLERRVTPAWLEPDPEPEISEEK